MERIPVEVSIQHTLDYGKIVSKKVALKLAKYK